MTVVKVGKRHYYRFWHRGRLYKRGGYPSKREALEAEWKKRREIGALGPRHRGSADAADVTLSDYAHRWLDAVRRELSPNTLRSYAERLGNHVFPALGSKKLAAIQRGDIRQLLIDKRQAGYSKNGVRLMRAALSSLLSSAADDGLIPANPVLQLRLRRNSGDLLTPADRQQKIRPFTPEQRDAFLTTAWKEAAHYALLFELLAKTGLRPSEAYALRPEDFDLESRTMRVERACVGRQIRPTKTYQSRAVDLMNDLIGSLRGSLRERTAKGRGGSAEWLFTTRVGTPLNHSKVSKVFRGILRKAKLDRHRLYDLRHTYACLHLATGAPITYVAAQLGHATPATTLRHYARWIPGQEKGWARN